MELQEIRRIVELMNEHGLTLFDITKKDFHLKLKKGTDVDDLRGLLASLPAASSVAPVAAAAAPAGGSAGVIAPNAPSAAPAPAAAAPALGTAQPVDPSTIPVVGRNEPCPCGSGLKYRQCHGKKPEA